MRGEKGTPREWAYVQLGAKWYARNDGWKLTENGELFDMSDAPFAQKPVPADAQSPEAKAAREQLQAVLDKLNPAAGETKPRKKADGDQAAEEGTQEGEKAAGKQVRRAAGNNLPVGPFFKPSRPDYQSGPRVLSFSPGPA